MADPRPQPAPRVMLGATLLIALQFASRAITFVANQLLLRYLTAELLGIATQLEVYYLSVLFFARESLRIAIQRQGPTSISPTTAPSSPPVHSTPSSSRTALDDANAAQAAVNLASLAPLLGVLLAAALGALYLQALAPATLASTPFLVPAVYLYALAALLELLAEPAFVLLQLRLQLAARARAEAVATAVKCAATLGLAVLLHGGGGGVLPPALGQLGYGAALLGVYLAGARAQRLRLVPGRVAAAPGRRPGPGPAAAAGTARADAYVLGLFYAPTLRLAATMAAQGLVKYFLTQGDSLLLGVLASAQVQGVYALAANYGSLAARLVFQPVEEAARGYFSRLLASVAEKNTAAAAAAGGGGGGQDGVVAEASASLTRLLHLYALLALPLLALAPAAAPRLLVLVAGPHWTAAGAGRALATYVYYIPLLALNGLLEAFVASVATPRDVARQSGWMAGFFAVFAAAAVLLVGGEDRWGWGWGAAGVVVANGANMALRVAWAAAFVRSWFAERGEAWSLARCLPGPGAVAVAAVTRQVVGQVMAEEMPVGVRSVISELGKVMGVAVMMLPVLAFSERRFLFECYRAVKAS